MHIALVAGELSGDLLGSGLIAALKARYPQARFSGIGGPGMVAQGLRSLVPMERLAVMGLVEVLRHLPELFRIRRQLYRHLLADPPQAFVGIDAPDFNLGLELALRTAGVKTVHFVSPSVWAWRQGRVHKIRRAVDRMLTLLPFEAAFYEANDVPVTFVGHPLADMVSLDDTRAAARASLGIDAQAQVVAMLPGSRGGEVSQLLPAFLGAATLLAARHPGLLFLVPAATQERRAQVESLIDGMPGLPPLRITDGDARTVMAASDVVLLASGTATLEAMLARRPMVVAYRLHRLTYLLLSRLVKSRFVSLPNLLADAALVPEILQDDVTPENLAAAVDNYLRDPQAVATLQARFAAMHVELRRGAAARAADAVLAVAGRGGARG